MDKPTHEPAATAKLQPAPQGRGLRYLRAHWLGLLLVSLIAFGLTFALVPAEWGAVANVARTVGWTIPAVAIFVILRVIDWLFNRLSENNYKTLLIARYLRKRRIAWVSLIAVTLCTAMVLVVISVMGGWLRMFRTSFHGLSGDVIVQSGSLSGFPHYQEMIDELGKLPEVQASAPVIQTFGLININNRKTMGVQVMGYPIEQIGKVNEFPRSLWRQHNELLEMADGTRLMSASARADLNTLHGQGGKIVDSGADRLMVSDKEKAALRRKADELTAKGQNVVAQELRMIADSDQALSDLRRDDVRERFGPIVDAAEKRLAPSDAERERLRKLAAQLAANPSFKLLPPEVVDYKREFLWNNPRAKKQIVDEVIHWDGLIAGTGVVNVRKDASGKLVGREDFLYRIPVKLTVMGVSASGNIGVDSKAERNYWIVDTSRTKVWQYDSNTVYVPFKVLQKDLGMEEQEAEIDGQATKIPARTSEIHIRVKEPWSQSSEGLIAVRQKVNDLVQRVMQEKSRQGLGYTGPMPYARTWEETQSKWLGAIEKEKTLVTFLFGMISIVAIFLIFCIFYMIVVEKTRDIGIIKSVGATSSGVAGIFLGYGAAIGIVGAGLGLLVGYLVVHHINTLHDWMGRAMNVQVWDPEVYAFDTIPNTMDPKEVSVIIGVAILSSIIGALVPAIRAARLNPVESLRWE